MLTAVREGGPAPADWAALARDLSGQLVRPGDASYDADKRLYDPRFDGLSPAGIGLFTFPQAVLPGGGPAFLRRPAGRGSR
jgi:hypothetical protein